MSEPQPKYKIGSPISQAGSERRGVVAEVGPTQPELVGDHYQYRVRWDDNGRLSNWLAESYLDPAGDEK